MSRLGETRDVPAALSAGCLPSGQRCRIRAGGDAPLGHELDRSVQGPYPVGNPSAQPDLRFAFPSAETGARDQTLRLMVRPSYWGPQMRLRLSNALGTLPVTFDGVFAGLQRSGSVIEPGSNRAVSFGGKASVTVPPGQAVWSDPVALPFVRETADPALLGRRLAVSLHVAGESGPMTWHAKALTTSYVTPPGAGAKGDSDGVLEFPFSTASWSFFDALDMAGPEDSPRGCRSGRFHNRWHRQHHERRRSLA